MKIKANNRFLNIQSRIMQKNRKFKLSEFKLIGALLLIISLIDSYFLIKNEGFPQLFWFCNSGLYLLAMGFYFRRSIIISAILLGALVVQIPWVLDFFPQLFFKYKLFGFSSYMFDYGFNNVRFYIELDHLILIPLSIYGSYRLGFHKNAWAFAGIAAIILNLFAYSFSSAQDNINCVFYSCFDKEINAKEDPLAYVAGFTLLVIILLFALNKAIYWSLKKKLFFKIKGI